MKKIILCIMVAFSMLVSIPYVTQRALAYDTNVGDIEILSNDEISSKLSSFANVTVDSSGVYRITLTKDIKGRVNFNQGSGNVNRAANPGASPEPTKIIFDANGYVVNGAGYNEAICLNNGSNVTMELVGSGSYMKGNNNAIFAGSGSTLIIKEAKIYGDLFVSGNNVYTALLTNKDYYTVTINGEQVRGYEAKNTNTIAFTESVYDADILIVAQYPELRTVTFDVHGHGTAPAALTIDYGSTLTLPTAPQAIGYIFGGWYKEAACTNKWLATDVVTRNTTLYAKWTLCNHQDNTNERSHFVSTTCSVCGATLEKVQHTFDQEAANIDYLKTPADCTHAPVYYKSCLCGESSKGSAQEATFSYGEANGHIVEGDWLNDETSHWHECVIDNEKVNLALHTEKTINVKEATVNETGYSGDVVCSVCGYVIMKGHVIDKLVDPQTDDSKDATKTTSPQTGDNTMGSDWLGLMLISGLATILLAKRYKNRA